MADSGKMAVPCRNLCLTSDLSSRDLFLGRKCSHEKCREIAHFARTPRNDFYCNCPLCDDELGNDLDCNVCFCPTTCSSGIYCDDLSRGTPGYFEFDFSFDPDDPEAAPADSLPLNNQACADVSCFKSLTLV